jgi:hypothetical protein
MQYHLTAKSLSGNTYNSLISDLEATQYYIDLKLRVDKFGSCTKFQDSILITMQRYKGE